MTRFPFSGRCLVDGEDFDTLDEYADHELRHKGEDDRRRNAMNEARWAINHRNQRRARKP